ncbi:MAG: hypothetical protein V3V14_09680 [Saprospiraceae bacterium]
MILDNGESNGSGLRGVYNALTGVMGLIGIGIEGISLGTHIAKRIKIKKAVDQYNIVVKQKNNSELGYLKLNVTNNGLGFVYSF